MMTQASFSRIVRPALFHALLAASGGILFSMAFSSVAFAVAVLLYLILLYGAHRGNYLRAILVRSGLEWYFLVWIAAVALMVLCAQHPGSALISAKRLLLISFVFMLPAVLRSEGDLRRFLLLLAGIAGLHSLLSIVLFFLGDASRLGIFQHYMTGGGLRMMLLLLLLPFLFDKRTAVIDRRVLGIAVMTMFIALILTQTRSSWMGFAAGAVLLGVLRYRVLLPVLLLCAVTFMLIAPGQYQDRILHMFTTDSSVVAGKSDETEAVVWSNRSRVRMIETGWRMFLDKPVCGLGDGEMHDMYREYVPDAIKDEGGHLHNTYIHVLATHGIVGFIALVILFIGVTRLFIRGCSRDARSMTGMLGLGALAAFFGFLVNGFAEYNFGDHEIVLMLWMITGLVVSSRTMTAIDDEAGAQTTATEVTDEEAV
jgi:O-antigen ligase